MTPFDITLTPEQISGTPDGVGILTQTRLVKIWENGKATENVEIEATAVFDKNDYEKVEVRVAGDKLPITTEQIKAKGTVKVRFKNLVARFGRRKTGEIGMFCRADSMEVLN